MVAKVISGKDIQGALNYNEQKVLEGNARCICASGFLKDVNDLRFYDKLTRFTDLNERNTRTKTNTLHISLNFDVTENLSVEELNAVASTYMNKIGFGDQPYLVYEHKDAVHPHVHIVTTIIQQDGKRIPVHYLGKNQSEKARKEIEIEFGLVKASGKTKDQQDVIRPVDVQKVIYGKSETRRSISRVVRMVTRSYKYTSLPELNAILKQYNIVADRGTEKSTMFANKGLIYSIIGSDGKRVGIPVKASSIYKKPTLSFLENQFKLNEVLRQPHRDLLKKKIDQALQSAGVNNKEQFVAALHKADVGVLFRSNAEGRTYGVTFVDNQTRVVFNGSALGKPYSAQHILEKLAIKPDTIKPYRPGFEQGAGSIAAFAPVKEVFKDLVTADGFDPVSPEAALKLRKRKRKKRIRRH